MAKNTFDAEICDLVLCEAAKVLKTKLTWQIKNKKRKQSRSLSICELCSFYSRRVKSWLRCLFRGVFLTKHFKPIVTGWIACQSSRTTPNVSYFCSKLANCKKSSSSYSKIHNFPFKSLEATACSSSTLAKLKTLMFSFKQISIMAVSSVLITKFSALIWFCILFYKFWVLSK